jgi:predicted KAP-like P-loop ATPase
MKEWISKIRKCFSKASKDIGTVREIQPEHSNKNDSISSDSQKSYSADAPLTDPEKDEFGRYPFAKRIAKTIINRKDSSSLVIALYGKWGEGKTTVLNYIEGELSKDPNIVAIAFNPWRFPSETELLSSFYFVLAKNLGQSLPTVKEKIGGWVEEYLPPAAALFDRADLAKEFGSLLSKVKLEELRDRIGNMLVEEGKLVVVLMDDIDRLEKTEIHAVFRLVKLSANLKNLVYILAFDDEVVSDALQERYGTQNIEAGRNFLEKIVQVPIDLPSIEAQRLRNFCFSAIDTILNHCEIQLTNDEVQQFVIGFNRGIEVRLQTPRMAVRYANILLFSLPMVNGEVNIVDFLLIEAIRAFYPGAYDVIRYNKDAFLGKGLTNFTGSQTDRDNFRNTIDQTFNDLESREAEALKSLLTSLFPRLQTVFGNTHYGTEWDGIWSKEKRIAADSYFSRYFCIPYLQEMFLIKILTGY